MPSYPTAARPEHINPAKAQENDIKNSFVKIIELFKQETKESLKEIEEKTTQKKEINKFLKE